MSKKIIDQLWEVINGSIYVSEPEEMRIEFTGKTIKVKRAIAFNVGDWLAHHIVETHNARVDYENIGMKQFAEFLDGSPERFKVK